MGKSLLCLLWLPFFLWSQGFCHLRGHAKESKDEKLRRRLSAWARHIQVIEHEPEVLDEKGLTPMLEISGLTLRHVFTVNKDNPQLVGHAKFTDEYHEGRRLRETEIPIQRFARQRRLSAIQTDAMVTLGTTPFTFFTPRDRILLFTVLNAAVLPQEAYENASLNYWSAAGKVHAEPGKMLYTKTAADINDPSLTGTGTWTPTLMGGNFSGTDVDIANSWRDGKAAYETASSVRASAAAQSPGWKNEYFRGSRIGPCYGRLDTEPRCWLDPGVAVSVYEEAVNTIVVFHTDWSVDWYDYVLWARRSWIIDEVETQVVNQWTIDARQEISAVMLTRKGSTDDEKQELCAFKDATLQPFKDVSTLSSLTDVAVSNLENFGYWFVIKKIVRLILPETRDRVLEKSRTIYFTGSGFGGVWSTLSSIWLKKADDASYESINIAGGGWQCFARSLSFDMSPWDSALTHIKVYAHIMDVYARMDYVSGYVCLYGAWNFTVGSDAQTFCSGIVGFTGPQLLYRGDPRGTYASSATEANVKEGRKDFDACHYYTHSVLYAAILFLNDKVLMADGTTDAGCTTLKAIPQNDNLNQCPSASRVEDDCADIASNTQDLPVKAMLAVSIGLAGAICCFGVIGYICLQRVRNDMWVFGHDKRSAQKLEQGPWKTFLALFGMDQARNAKMGKAQKKNTWDRAKQARDRVKQARLKKHENSTEGGKRKLRKKGDKNNSEEQWRAMQERLDQSIDAALIGKPEDELREPVVTFAPGKTFEIADEKGALARQNQTDLVEDEEVSLLQNEGRVGGAVDTAVANDKGAKKPDKDKRKDRKDKKEKEAGAKEARSIRPPKSGGRLLGKGKEGEEGNEDNKKKEKVRKGRTDAKQRL